MNITFRTGIPKFIKPKLNLFLDEAISFLIKKYPHIPFDQANIVFTYNTTGGRFTFDKTDHTVRVGITSKLHLYKKKMINLTTPYVGLNVGYDIATTSLIIHELTHFVQHIEQRKYSELETTINEIEFLKEKNNYWYSQLVKVNL